MSSDQIQAVVSVDTDDTPFATVFIPGRPAVINRERSKHWREHREQTRIARRYGFYAAQRLRQQNFTFPTPASIITTPIYNNRQSWPDVGNWAPAAKAIIDGFVDADAWRDDSAEYITLITHTAPHLDRTIEGPGLYLTVTKGPELHDLALDYAW